MSPLLAHRKRRDRRDRRAVRRLLATTDRPGTIGARNRRLLMAAEAAGYTPRTVRRWVARHGRNHLELVLSAGVKNDALRDHLASGTTPSEWALRELADPLVPIKGPVSS